MRVDITDNIIHTLAGWQVMDFYNDSKKIMILLNGEKIYLLVLFVGLISFQFLIQNSTFYTYILGTYKCKIYIFSILFM